MREPQIPGKESERMALVRQLQILDSHSEEVHDGITCIASLFCKTPVSTITTIDEDWRWFKSLIGSTSRENPRIYSFCTHTILVSEILTKL